MTSYEDRMQRVIAYIHDHPAEDLSLDRLAEVAAMSRFHWHRVFRGLTGETCAQAVRRIRLMRGSHELVRTDDPVAEVAARVGYPNLASFTRAFSEAFGVPPGAFRSRGTLPPNLNAPSKGDPTMFPIDIETHAARRVAAIPHKGAYMTIGKEFETLGSLLGARGLWPHVESMLGIYYDNPMEVAEADLRSHAGAIVPADLALDAPLEEILIPEGRHAVLHFTGPYTGLAKAYDYLYGQWLAEAGHQLRDFPSYEIYMNSPMDTAPDALKTEICLPIV